MSFPKFHPWVDLMLKIMLGGRDDTFYSFEVAVAPPMLNSATPILIYEREARSRQWALGSPGAVSSRCWPVVESLAETHSVPARQMRCWGSRAETTRYPSERAPQDRFVYLPGLPRRGGPPAVDLTLPTTWRRSFRELGYTSNCVRQMLAGPRTRHRGGTLLVNNSWMAM